MPKYSRERLEDFQISVKVYFIFCGLKLLKLSLVYMLKIFQLHKKIGGKNRKERGKLLP